MNEESIKYIISCEKYLKEKYEEIEDVALYNSYKVMNAFHKFGLAENHFYPTTGYGYNDAGREIIEKIYASIFKSEDALVRSQFISGTHALTTTLFAMLRPGNIMLSITGKPYDTLDKVIGIMPNPSSLKSYGVLYRQIELINNDFDYEKIKEAITTNKIKLITIQRSKGYTTRESIDINKLEKVIKYIKEIDSNIIIMVDNCYCEFVSTKEPTEVGADLAVGSLIKNLGAGIASNGGYVVGKESLISLVAERLNVPGQGKEVGPSLGASKDILKGLYLAPSIVASSLKTACLVSKVINDKGYEVSPMPKDKRCDIVQNIIFNNKDKLISFCNLIQKNSPIDSNVTLEASDMPGYEDKIIMASGSFTQGSSIELSCDGPLRSPYIAYMQGGLTYEYGKILAINIYEKL